MEARDSAYVFPLAYLARISRPLTEEGKVCAAAKTVLKSHRKPGLQKDFRGAGYVYASAWTGLGVGFVYIFVSVRLITVIEYLTSSES